MDRFGWGGSVGFVIGLFWVGRCFVWWFIRFRVFIRLRLGVSFLFFCLLVGSLGFGLGYCFWGLWNVLTRLDMNYVCVVYAVVGCIIAVDWVVRGKRRFRGQHTRHQEVEEHVGHYAD